MPATSPDAIARKRERYNERRRADYKEQSAASQARREKAPD